MARGGRCQILEKLSVAESYFKFLEVPGGEGGFSGLDDVDNTTIMDTSVDDQESFFFAEVMKYL